AVTGGSTSGFWDLGGRRVRPASFPSASHFPAVTADGRRAAACHSRTVKLFEPGRPGEALKLEHTDQVVRTCFSPDGTQLATATARNVWLWNVADGMQLTRFLAFPTGIKSLAFHPNGKQLVAADRAGEVRFWDTATQREQSRFAPGIGCIQELAFSPDG